MSESAPEESNEIPVRTRKCPKCGKRYSFRSVGQWKPYPFCSERCRLIDLGSWLNEDYQIVEPAMDPDALGELSDEELMGMFEEQPPEDFGH